MTDGGYDAFDDPYCYRGTFVLKNRLHSRVAAVLEAFELEMMSCAGRRAVTCRAGLVRHIIAEYIGICFKMSIPGPVATARSGPPKAETGSVSRSTFPSR